MVTKRAKKGTKKIKDLPAKRLTNRRAKSVRGGWSGSSGGDAPPTESLSFTKQFDKTTPK